MAKFIEVKHKDLKETARVPVSALRLYERSGWEPVDKKDAAEAVKATGETSSNKGASASTNKKEA
jgi:hypothetical protein